MLKQEFKIGQAVICTLSSMKGIHTVTAVRLKEEEDYRGKPSASFLEYQLDGKEDMWCTRMYLKPYIDTELMDKFETWLRDHLTSYLCQGEKGNLYAREELYDKLKEDFSEIEELAKKKGLNND